MMAQLLLVFALVLLISVASGKVYERCELARELKQTHKLPQDEIATWVCIAKHESTFNTSAVNHESGDFGLFQISNLYWCSPPGNGIACNRPCSAFQDDDISDDVSCIRRIFKEHSRLSGNGFNAWVVYPLYCKGDVSQYVEGCFDHTAIIDNTIIDSGIATTSKPEDDEDPYDFPPLPAPPKKTVKVSPITTTVFPLKSSSHFQNLISDRNGADNNKVKSSFGFETFSRISANSQGLVGGAKLKGGEFSRISTTTENLKGGAKFSPRLGSLFSAGLKPTTQRFQSTSKPFFKFSTTSSKPFVTKKLTTKTPFSIVFESVHSEHKREQKFYGSHETQYSFVWKPNGFKLIKN